MTDESLVNGVAAAEGEAPATESLYNFETTTTKVSDLVKEVEVLEREKVQLIKENEEVKEKVQKLGEEVLGLTSDKEKMEELVEKAEYGKTLGVITGRAADLKTEVLRLQHDLLSAMSEGDDANKELLMVKKALEESKLKAAELEKEKELIKERFLGETEEVKKA